MVADPDFDELDGAVREDEDDPPEPEDVELPALELPELDEPELDEPLELDPELGLETACSRSGIEAVGASRVRLTSPPPPDPPDPDEDAGGAAAGGAVARDCCAKPTSGAATAKASATANRVRVDRVMVRS